MNERLTNKMANGEVAEPFNRVQALAMAKKLSHFEDLQDQGLIVELPCKVGDSVFSLWSRVDSKKQYIRSAIITVSNLNYYLSRIQDGRSFATHAKAQAEIDRMGGKR